MSLLLKKLRRKWRTLKRKLQSLKRKWQNLSKTAQYSLIFAMLFMVIILLTTIILFVRSFATPPPPDSIPESVSEVPHDEEELYNSSCPEGTLAVSKDEYGFYFDGKYYIKYTNAYVLEDAVEPTGVVLENEVYLAKIERENGCIVLKDGDHHSWNLFRNREIYRLIDDPEKLALEDTGKYYLFSEYSAQHPIPFPKPAGEWIAESPEIYFDDILFKGKIEESKQSVYSTIGLENTRYIAVKDPETGYFFLYAYTYFPKNNFFSVFDLAYKTCYEFKFSRE